MSDKLWFRAKRYGYGWYPVTWQGWLSLAVYVALIFILVSIFPARRDSSPAEIILFLSLIILATVGLIALCARKGEPAGWRWGEDKKRYEIRDKKQGRSS